jgi:hypothetical protein
MVLNVTTIQSDPNLNGLNRGDEWDVQHIW